MSRRFPGSLSLKELNLSRTEVRDLSPLEGLTNLRTLALDGLGNIELQRRRRIPDLKILRDPRPESERRSTNPAKPSAIAPSVRRWWSCPPAASRWVRLRAKRAATTTRDRSITVKIAQPFAVSKYEVRFDEWMPCVQDGVCKALPDEGWGRGARPVINVSWEEAKRYVEWLSRKAGHPYRLLTEAEWEYAARAESKGLRYWGDGEKDACAYANVSARRSGATTAIPYTAPVGMFQPNAFGLHDMLGNVWEWTEDCYHDSYQGRAGGRFGLGECELWVPRDPWRRLGQRSAGRAVGRPRQGRARRPHRRLGVSSCQDAYPLNLYSFTPCSV